MWPICSLDLSSLLWLLGPLILGLLTAWWLRSSAVADTDADYNRTAHVEHVSEPEPERFVAPAPPPAPVAAPIVTPSVAPLAAAPIAAALTAIGIPAAIGNHDNLLQIKGVGPKLNELLNSLGIHRFDQIAAWGASEVGKVDEHLGAFSGRIDRDRWIEQAGLLARGAIAEFEAKFGQLDSENQ
jgi:predicted flap endonuclease-1-like 5' DNA nuclease